jgi:TolB-like protein/Tfp pilus assembly protein PilF
MSDKPPPSLSFFAQLKQRKLVQWALAYVAAAFALLQGMDIVAQRFGWPEQTMRLVIIALSIGLLVTLVLAWYHGERGAQRVSGTELLILALLLAVGGGFLWHFASASREPAAKIVSEEKTNTVVSAISEKSIAVLPFENLSDDKNTAYFSDGITEEILNALAQIPGLKVAARRSAFQFKGNDLDLRKISEVLGVAHILEGSLQKAGDQVRISVQLVDAQKGLQVWSDKYDRKLDNVFAVEDEIARAIATKLRVQLTGGGGQPLVPDSTSNSQAHELYLRGLTLLAARGPGLRDAANAFQQAVQLDPNYAQAWGALAETELLLPAYQLDSMEASFPRADSAAQRALALDQNTASAYVALGLANTFRCQWPDADRAFRRAVTLAPSDAETVNQYGQFLSTVGQAEPSLREIERAQQLDPLSPIIGVIRTGMLGALHRDEAATAQVESILKAHPDFAPAHAVAILLYVDRKLYPQAETHFRALAKINGQNPDLKGLLARGMADPTQRAAAVQSLETAPENADLRSDPLWYAFYLISLDQRDRALDQLEIYATKHNSSFGAFLWGRSFDPLRNDPRFKAVLAKLNLPYTPAP